MEKFEDYQATIARVYGQKNNVIGTGFLVAPQYLLTCAHVVIGALELKTTDFPQKTLTVDFPEGKISFLKAEVILWQPCPSYFQSKLANIKPGEDLALLKLEKAVNLSPLPIQSPETVHNLAFKIWGFPSPNGEETEGTILARQSSRQWYQLRVAQNSLPIQGGFSGSPLWNSDQGIIGMTVAASRHNPETDVGGRDANAIAGSELYELWHKQGELIHILEGVAWSVVREAYQFARHHYISTQWNTEEPKTLAEAIADLYTMQKQSGQNHQLAFVVYLLNSGELNQGVKTSLQIWATTHFWGFEAIKQEISRNILYFEEHKQEIGRKIPSQDDQDTDKSCLWIILRKATGDSCFIDAAYFIKSIQNYQFGASPDLIFNVDNTAEIKKANLNREIEPILTSIRHQIPSSVNNNIIIEVFLPFENLNLAPDQWLFKNQPGQDRLLPLGNKYPVVLRILERVPDGPNDYPEKGIWQQKWNNRSLTKLCQEALICTTRKPSEISIALDNFTVSGIRSPYPPSEHQGENCPDSLVWDEGIPFWLWLRKPLDSCTEPTVFDTLLTEETLQTLPQRLKAIRNDALNDPHHLAAHISFLADNPEKMPNLEITDLQSLGHL